MAHIENSFTSIRYLDTLARRKSFVHDLDPRAMLLTTLVFIVTVVSFDKYAITRMVPFVIYPVVLIGLGKLPAGFIMKKILLVAPFAILLGMFNPLFDRSELMVFNAFSVSGGWVSFASLLFRFLLTVSAALILIAVTSFHGFCLALEKFRVPEVFIMQLLFLYRYIFVLVDEATRMLRARSLRTFSSGNMGLATYGSLIGHLLLRATNRAERIHRAMSCRGFDGHVRLLATSRMGGREILFVAGWSLLFFIMRTHNIPMLIGTRAMEFLS